MANYKLTADFKQVKRAGNIATMRVIRGNAEISNSETGDAFPLYAGEILTVAASVAVWARGDGLLCSFETAPE